MATKKTNTPDLSVKEEPVKAEAAAEEKPAEDPEKIRMQKEIEALKKQLAEQKQAGAKREANETDIEMVRRIEAETEEKGIDPWTVEVELLIPHREKTEDPWYWLNVNNRSVQIPANDRYQKVKLPWASILVDHLASEKRSMDFQDSIQVYDPETNPHKA